MNDLLRSRVQSTSCNSLRPSCAGRLARIEQWQRDKGEKIDAIHGTLMGGDNPATGLTVRVDRLERSVADHRWTQRAILVAALAAVGTAVVNLLT